MSWRSGKYDFVSGSHGCHGGHGVGIIIRVEWADFELFGHRKRPKTDQPISWFLALLIPLRFVCCPQKHQIPVCLERGKIEIHRFNRRRWCYMTPLCENYDSAQFRVIQSDSALPAQFRWIPHNSSGFRLIPFSSV